MNSFSYVTGAAGTGKTHNLARMLVEWFRDHSLDKKQGVLAITRMHGSRKRLQERLASHTINAKISVSTVDRFALQILNRWRTSLGFDCCIVPDHEGGFKKDELGYRATFQEIMKAASSLTSSAFVAKTIANSFPIFVVDEFQDCVGDQLSLISNLKDYADMIVAGDPFQALDGDESACEWAMGLEGKQFSKIIRLENCRRTECNYILEAAKALLKNRQAVYCGDSLPFLLAPRYSLAVWKTLPKNRPNKTTALIYPAHRALRNLQKSVEIQGEKRSIQGKNKIWFPWLVRIGDAELEKATYQEFAEALQENDWVKNGKWRDLYIQTQCLCKAKGYVTPPEIFVRRVVNEFIQSKKFVQSRPIKFEATTVHGAKNREFDHVYVLWDNNLCGQYSNEMKRRLLYNAITRAKESCTVVAIGSKKNVSNCPVLSLLGEPA